MSCLTSFKWLSSCLSYNLHCLFNAFFSYGLVLLIFYSLQFLISFQLWITFTHLHFTFLFYLVPSLNLHVYLSFLISMLSLSSPSLTSLVLLLWISFLKARSSLHYFKCWFHSSLEYVFNLVQLVILLYQSSSYTSRSIQLYFISALRFDWFIPYFYVTISLRTYALPFIRQCRYTKWLLKNLVSYSQRSCLFLFSPSFSLLL